MVIEIHGTEWKAQVSGSDHDVFLLSEFITCRRQAILRTVQSSQNPGARRTGVPLEENCRPTAPVAFGPGRRSPFIAQEVRNLHIRKVFLRAWKFDGPFEFFQ